MRLNRLSGDQLQGPVMDLPGDFTVEGWFSIEDLRPTSGFPLVSQWTSTGSLGWMLYHDNVDRIIGYVNATVVNGPIAPTLGSRHYAFAKQGTTGLLFYDGILVASGTVPASAGTAPGLRFGVYHGTSPGFVGGSRDVRIWNYARTGEQIRAGLSGIRGDEPGLVAWYPLLGDTKDYAQKAWTRDFVEHFDTMPTGRTSDSGHTLLSSTLGVGVTVDSGQLVQPVSQAVTLVWSDVGADVDALLVYGIGLSNPGLRFRATDQNNYMQIYSNGTLRRVVAGATTDVPLGGGPVVLPGSIRVRAVGDQITVTLNGQLRGTVTDGSHRTARGLGITQGNTAGGESRYAELTAAVLSPYPQLDLSPVGSPRLQLALQR